MKRRRHSDEQILRKLREASTELAAGATIPQVCKKLQISEATFHRWRQRSGGTKAVERLRGQPAGIAVDLAQRLRELEKQNKRLKQLVAELTLENAFLKDALEGKNN